MPSRRAFLHRVTATALTATALPIHAQQPWPAKPIRWIMPFAPGGTSSLVARSIAAEITKASPQFNFVIENKGGGGGVPAMQELKAAPADGYTFIMSHIGLMAVNPLIYPNAGYDIDKDFAPVTLVNRLPSLFCVHKDVPVTDIKSLVAYAKARPGQMNYASAGNASAGHLAHEALKLRTGIFITHIPYRGTGPALTDVLAGRVEMFSAGTPALLPHIKSGALRCIGVGSPTRISALPDVQAVSETYPGFETEQWYGIHAKAGTPREIIVRLQQEVAKALKSPEVVAKHEAESATAGGGTPEEYGEFVKREQGRWRDVVVKAGIRAG